MYKEDLAFNNPQWLYAMKPKQPTKSVNPILMQHHSELY